MRTCECSQQVSRQKKQQSCIFKEGVMYKKYTRVKDHMSVKETAKAISKLKEEEIAEFFDELTYLVRFNESVIIALDEILSKYTVFDNKALPWQPSLGRIEEVRKINKETRPVVPQSNGGREC